MSVLPPDDFLRASDLRYEIKLVCGPHWLAQVRSWIKMHPAGFVVAYPPRRVNSLYFDTLQLNSLNDNLMGVNARQKLRLRWYGDVVTDIRPILELKQRRNLLGRKRQYQLSRSLDLTDPWMDILNAIEASVEGEWRALMQTVNRPTLLNHYRREYYVTPEGTVRVTLDFDQVAYDQRFTRRPNLRIRLPMDDNVVIEIKGGQEQGERIQEIAAQFPVRRHRNSKYVRGLEVALR